MRPHNLFEELFSPTMKYVILGRMLDIQFIRDNAQLVAKKSKQKGYDVDIDFILQRDKAKRDALEQIQKLQQQRNELAQAAKGKKPAPKDIDKGKQLKEQIAEREKVLK